MNKDINEKNDYKDNKDGNASLINDVTEGDYKYAFTSDNDT